MYWCVLVCTGVYDLCDLCDLSHGAGWEPCNLHVLAHVPVFDLYYTDPAQHLIERQVRTYIIKIIIYLLVL